MSETTPRFDGLTSEAEFEQALGNLIASAQADGIDVEGGWKLDGENDSLDLGIEIYRVVRRPE